MTSWILRLNSLNKLGVMMRKITRTDVHGMFNRLCFQLQWRGVDTNGWQLDYIAEYGGFIVECVEQTRRVSIPLDSVRRKTTEMYYSLYFACNAVELTPKISSCVPKLTRNSDGY